MLCLGLYMFHKKSKKFHKNKQRKAGQAGFGLIELLVSISILVIVMSIVMFKRSSFNSAVLLRSQAYEIALHARNIQLNAVSALGEGGDFRQIYGLEFSKGGSTYVVFKDLPPYNYFYNSGVGEQDYSERGILDRRFKIEEISFVGGGAGTVDKVAVVFERPNFDARFFIGENSEVTSASAVELKVRLIGTTGSTVNEVRTVEITKTGQISVK